MITIFTPTYNRANLLTALFESLLTQTNYNFEWIIVDDGSIDNTQDIVNDFVLNAPFSITYHRQINSGKHIAINAGVQLANYEFFFIVDSDDKLPSNAIEIILNKINSIELSNLAGIAFRRAYFNNIMIGSKIPNTPLLANSITIRNQYNIHGDLVEIFKTDILKEHPFPENNEKFCPEVLVWNRIALKYNLLFFNDIIYQCEYIDGGLTANIVKVRMKSPINTCTCYAEMYAINKGFPKEKAKALINFWRFYQAASAEAKKEIKIPQSNFNFLFKMLGTIFHKKDLKTTAS